MELDINATTLHVKFDELLEQELSGIYGYKDWLHDFKTNFDNEYPYAQHSFNYLLSMQSWDKLNSLFVSFIPVANGQMPISLTSILRGNILEPKETNLLSHLRDEFYAISHTKENNNNSSLLQDDHFPLLSSNSAKLLRMIIATGRCCWDNIANTPLSIGVSKSAYLAWQLFDDGAQRLQCMLPKDHMILLPVNPPFYFDPEKNKCGPLNIALPGMLLQSLLKLPPVPAHEIKDFYQSLQRTVGSKISIPEPHNEAQVRVSPVEPIPVLYLFGDSQKRNQCIGFARLNFRYLDQIVSLSNNNETLAFKRDGKLYIINRDFNKEKIYAHDLLEYGILAVSLSAQELLAEHAANQQELDFVVSLDEEKIMDFNIIILPELKSNGWEVTVDQSFPVYCINDPDEWYSRIEEDESNYDWFKLEVGITIDNQQINILPFLAKLVHDENNDMSPEYINNLDDNFEHMLQLEEGKFLILPNHRLKGFLRILTELYNSDSQHTDKLMLSKQEAAQLYQLEQFLGTSRLRWFGGEKLRILGEKLANFTEISKIRPSRALKASLRTYQQEGLNWLNFLREYDFGGVLADDMGLGKTIQVIALLLHEKQQKRLNSPCLIVVPTTLVGNWQDELTKFSPSLSVLTIHGPNRAHNFNEISKHDVVITTYPLLILDELSLLEHQYYYLILDEAQRIKNFLAKSVKVLHKLHAKHRLCLSGTPVENHLGELWSIFHFVMPGLLYEYKDFVKTFKVPIEKYKDPIRQKNLAARVAPFMLRRTKHEVLEELPDKTICIHTVKLGEKQRDLYESVRLAMEIKIQQAISKKGLKRSSIIILDALLKLRQVCNDPRLVKLTSAKKVRESAKLDALIKLVLNCIEQGRKILIFSSFTSMLTLIEKELIKYKLSYSLLTGQTKDRATQVHDFQNGITDIFLISLKAGGVGLNLTIADTVIHYDPWWNPAAEEQATDRAYRMGQDNPVTVYKLVTEGSIEEKILGMQQDKRALFDGLFRPTEQNSISKLSAQDLTLLFQPLSRSLENVS